MLRSILRVILLAATAGAIPVAAQSASLRVEVQPRFGAEPLVFDTSNYAVSGVNLSVTRLDFLVSGLALHQAAGGWIEESNVYACIKAREGRTNFEAGAFPVGRYDRIRFQVGLPADINHRDPANYPAGHALNPEVNGLYWGWAGGYVFLALEGGWQRPDGLRSGFSYHIATDRQLMTVELPVELDLRADSTIGLNFDVQKVFAQPNAIALNEATDSTHSRTNDDLAGRLRQNIESAFSLNSIRSAVAAPISSGASHIEMAATATPYRLTISRFFPQPDLPRDNPLTEEGVALGRKLFFDQQLSVNREQSCASCHRPGRAFSDTNAVSLGAEGQSGQRNATPLLNLAWKSSYFWDGRAASVREQVLQPIQNPIEMHENLPNLVSRLAQDSEYPKKFAAAFGQSEITADRVARALEQFLLVQVSFDSKFDRVLNGEAKFTGEEQRGFELFHTEYDPRRGQIGADCFHCHGGPLFQSQDFGNNGLDTNFLDKGRAAVTGRPGDAGKFAVPSLRNVELTAPYMHDGRFQTLEEVVEHYCTGMKRSETLDPNLAKHPDGGVPLNEADKKALVAFLKTLTDERFRPTPTVTTTSK